MAPNTDLIRAGHAAPDAIELQRIYNLSKLTKVDFLIAFNTDNAGFATMASAIQALLRLEGPDNKQYWGYGRSKADTFHLGNLMDKVLKNSLFSYNFFHNHSLSVVDGDEKQRAVMSYHQHMRTVMEFLHQQDEAMEAEPLLRDESTAALCDYKTKLIRYAGSQKLQFGTRDKSQKKLGEKPFAKNLLVVLPKSERKTYDDLPDVIVAMKK